MRPLLYGYLNPQSSSPDEVDSLKRTLAEYADRTGFRLVDVYIERPGEGRSALNALVDAMGKSGVRAVAVPTLYHFGHFPGLRNTLKEYLEIQSGARILEVYPSPDETA